MKPLVTGVHHFQAADFPTSHRLFEPGNTRRRAALLIVCSDLGINPFHLIPTNLADLYPLQNIGNIVLPSGAHQSPGESTVEQMVAFYKPTDIVICGHTPCSVLDSLNDPAWNELSKAAALLRQAQTILEQHYADIKDPEDRRDILARENVLVQLENIRTLGSVSLGLDIRELHLHGWLYRDKSIYAYEVRLEQFVPLAQ
jgi:carbonic anhydrase